MELAPSYAHRVFCLARDGRWFDAALTLNVAETLDLMDPPDVDLLQRFLDPELFDGAPPPLTADRLTPLRFVLYEALGEPRTIGTLPLAYLHADLQNRVGWRDRLEATERLVQSQAFGPGMLDFLYTEAKPAASGGIWDRVDAYQVLRRALVAGDTAHLDAALGQGCQLDLFQAHHHVGGLHRLGDGLVDRGPCPQREAIGCVERRLGQDEVEQNIGHWARSRARCWPMVRSQALRKSL